MLTVGASTHPLRVTLENSILRSLSHGDGAAAAHASFFPGSAAQPTPERPPRPAATIVVVRDGDTRHRGAAAAPRRRAATHSGAWVFPGRPGRCGRPRRACCCGRPRRRGRPARGSACRGRAGLLHRGDARMLRGSRACCSPRDGDGDARARRRSRRRLAPWRGSLHRGERACASLQRCGLRLAADRARLPQPLADAARPRQALRHALLRRRRRRAGGRARRHGDGRAAVDAPGRCAGPQRRR